MKLITEVSASLQNTKLSGGKMFTSLRLNVYTHMHTHRGGEREGTTLFLMTNKDLSPEIRKNIENNKTAY